VSSSDGGITWTATFTPSNNVTDTTNLITLDNTGSRTWRATPARHHQLGQLHHRHGTPTATIVVADNALNIGSSSGDHHLQRSGDRLHQRRPDGRQRHLSTVSSSDGGITWTATFTPTSNITDASNLITWTTRATQTWPATPARHHRLQQLRHRHPASDRDHRGGDNNLGIGQTSTVTITFSEAVTGFSLSDLSVANGTLSNLAAAMAARPGPRPSRRPRRFTDRPT
jgi:hypothetical protein